MSEILSGRDGGVMSIEFNRPLKKNAITGGMYLLLAAALAEAQADDAIRVVLFHGQGDVFTAGNDLEDFMKRPPAGEEAPPFVFLKALREAKKPLVAAVNGPAIGIGTTMLLHCELVYAGDNARFQMPFTQLGLVAENASSYLLPLVAGYQRAAELLLLGEPFDARKAREAGFVTHVLPAMEALEAARAAARKLAALPPKSVQATKALMKAAHAKAVEAQTLAESAQFRAMLSEPAAREAFSAFMERRKPDFSSM